MLNQSLLILRKVFTNDLTDYFLKKVALLPNSALAVLAIGHLQDLQYRRTTHPLLSSHLKLQPKEVFAFVRRSIA